MCIRQDNKINQKKIISSLCFVLLIISYFIKNPYISELLFWISVYKLSIWSHTGYSEHNVISFRLIVAYLLLFAMHIHLNPINVQVDIRLYGLTKNIIMIPIMLWIWPILNKQMADLSLVITCYICVAYMIMPKVMEGYFSTNAIVALGTVAMPYAIYNIFIKKKILYIISVLICAISFFYIDSETLILILCLQIAIIFFGFITCKYMIKNDRKIYYLLAVMGIFVLVIGIPFVLRTESLYLDLFDKFTKINMDRAFIWNNGIRQFESKSLTEKIFGTGNNLVQMQTIQHAGHNAILEMLLIYGFCGLILFIIETLYVIKIFLHIEKKKVFYIALAAWVGTYIEFMTHPFYSTFYIQKIVFITCLRVYSDTKCLKVGGMHEINKIFDKSEFK